MGKKIGEVLVLLKPIATGSIIRGTRKLPGTNLPREVLYTPQ